MKIKRMLSGMAASLLLLTGGLTVCLTGCSESSEKQDDGRLSVVASNFALYDLARAAAGDTCEVTMLISPGSESHDFEATLADIAKISEADVFVHIGNEDWVEDIFLSMGDEADGIRVVNALEVVEHHGTDHISGEACVIEEEHEHDHGEDTDEHVWTSIGNAEAILSEISSQIIASDASLQEAVEENTGAYIARLDEIDAGFFALTENAARNKIVIADRFPFAYMTARYSLAYEAAFSGCTSDTEPSLAVINSLIETVKNEDIPVIFVTEGSDRKTAEAVAAETGAEILELHSAQSISKEDFGKGVTYADLMEKNLAALGKALGE